MKVTVVGAGTIGSAVVYALSKTPHISQIHVCDSRHGVLQNLQEWLPDPRIRTHEVDARNWVLLKPLLHHSRVIINCVASEMSAVLAQVAISEGIHFCDLGGYREITKQVLSLNKEAADAGVWIVPNCGVAPGLVNILLMHGVELFDHVHNAQLRVGTVPLHPTPPLNFASFFSAEKIIEEYTEPAFCIKDGVMQNIVPLTGVEDIYFEDELGKLEAFYTSGVLAHIPTNLPEKVDNLNFKTIRYPNHASQMSFLLSLGFGEKRLIDVGTHLTYRDVLVRRIRQRLGGEPQDVVLLRVVLTGIVAGKEKSLVYEMQEQYSEKDDMTAIKRCMGASVAIVASMLAEGVIEGAGASTPEQIIPKELFLNTLKEYGIKLTMNWHDGKVDVSKSL